jgi:hypothetical protein
MSKLFNEVFDETGMVNPIKLGAYTIHQGFHIGKAWPAKDCVFCEKEEYLIQADHVQGEVDDIVRAESEEYAG